MVTRAPRDPGSLNLTPREFLARARREQEIITEIVSLGKTSIQKLSERSCTVLAVQESLSFSAQALTVAYYRLQYWMVTNGLERFPTATQIFATSTNGFALFMAWNSWALACGRLLEWWIEIMPATDEDLERLCHLASELTN
jgi:hypothetical protein